MNEAKSKNLFIRVSGKERNILFLLIYIIAITNEYCRYGGILPYTAPANC